MAGTGKGPGKLVCQSRAKEGDRQEVNRGVWVCLFVCVSVVGGGCRTVGIRSSRAF